MKSKAIKLNNSMDGICYFRPGVQRSSRRGIKGGREGEREEKKRRINVQPGDFAKEEKKKERFNDFSKSYLLSAVTSSNVTSFSFSTRYAISGTANTVAMPFRARGSDARIARR